jgi:hypothetical protein
MTVETFDDAARCQAVAHSQIGHTKTR